MNIWRLVTYIISAALGITAIVKPQYASTIGPIAGAIAGWATPHPVDTVKKED